MATTSARKKRNKRSLRASRPLTTSSTSKDPLRICMSLKRSQSMKRKKPNKMKRRVRKTRRN